MGIWTYDAGMSDIFPTRDELSAEVDQLTEMSDEALLARLDSLKDDLARTTEDEKNFALELEYSRRSSAVSRRKIALILEVLRDMNRRSE